MGLGQERLRPGNSGGRIAAAGQILLLFLPQHEAAGNFESERTLSRLVSACAGAGSKRHAQPENRKRIGTQLLMAGTIWKGVNHYGNEQIGAH